MSDFDFNIGGDACDSLKPVNREVNIKKDECLFLIAGPCAIENEDMCLRIAEGLCEISDETRVPVVFKASLDKANRSSISGFRGIGFQKGLDVLAKVRSEFQLPIITDVHECCQVEAISEVADCLQVPAFLCRQTDLFCACARTLKPLNVKKGQFMSPEEMSNVTEKIRQCSNEKIMLTERSTFFGYNRLVNDMCGIEIMKAFGAAVVFDATHSVQQPGGLGNVSGGVRAMAPILARSAVAAGADGLFLEVHIEPEKAMSDAPTIMPIDWVSGLLEICKRIYETVRGS